MPRGQAYRVEIDLPYGELTDIQQHLKVGARFRLQVGGVVIGEGEIERV